MFKYLFAKNEDIPAGASAVFFGFSSILWFIVGTGLGSFNAAKLAFPDFVTGNEFLAFGHCSSKVPFRPHLEWRLL